ncbi:unnamed protein product [Euphydryas editha]|uniref:Tc1-like transposase DDE domain-containing protein n=1 Tax=Euphydryas editha TaxID=104508 RepID=A0AAU9U7G3_EUPED|nr:unnamed protein product [Euphydryas editha]
MSYKLSEYAEMHYFYGVAQGDGVKAARLYREQLQRRGGPQPPRYPDHHVFINTHNTLIAGRIPGQRCNREAIPRADPDRTEVVLEAVHRNPSTSTRAMARALDIPRTSIQAVKDEGYHAFHSRRVQALQPTDYQLRIDFCQTMLRKEQDDPGFFNKVLWSDESRFERSGVFNIHNYHTWAIENPHAVRASTFQDRFSVNLWSGVLNGKLIGPFQLPTRLDGAAYKNFLENELPLLLEDVSLELRRTMVFQNDGAPCHYSIQVRNFLNETYRNRWIGRSGPIRWPPRSPDLNPIDFFIWGYYKEIVYARECLSEQELRQNIAEAQRVIGEKREAFRRLKHNFLRM